ncbi:MAG: glucosamine-6-phosphate deaminase [Caldilineaceae bacterium]
MDIIITDNYAAMSRAAADFVAAAIAAKPESALVFPTGGTPLGLYEELIQRYEQGAFDPSRLRIFLLDEYVGIGPEDARSLLGWLQRTLFTPLHIQPAQITPLPGNAANLETACRQFEQAVMDAGGLDLAILGIGPNGHLGYNEPPADAAAPTRVLELTQSSLDTCAAAWGGRDRLLPHAITAGMDLLLAARQKLLIVNGAHKRAILHAALYGPVQPEVPASYLQMADNVTVIVDRAAMPDG